MKKTLLLTLLLLLIGCQRGRTEFIQVCASHQRITKETNEALISAITSDMVKMKAAGKLTPENEQITLNLIGRLTFITKQSDVIYKYTLVNEADDALLQELIRNNFTGQPSTTHE